VNKFTAAKKIHSLQQKKIYSDTQVNIAVHIRVGDIEPTPQSYFLTLLPSIMALLSDTPYQLFAFSDGPLPPTFSALQAFFKQNGAVILDSMEPLPTFFHLSDADVLVTSSSGFSQLAAILTYKSLVLCPPSREKFEFRFCPRGGFAVEKSGKLDWETRLRILQWKQQWQLIQQAKHTLFLIKQPPFLGTNSSFSETR